MPRLASSTRFALGAAQDGRLYLAASGEMGRHSLVSIEIQHRSAYRHHAAWDEVVTRGVDSGRFAVTFLILRDGHQSVASYSRGTPHFHRGDCMGDVF